MSVTLTPHHAENLYFETFTPQQFLVMAVDKLLDYCDLRIRSYNFLYKAIDENSNAYKDSIIYYNAQIKMLIDELKK